MRLDPDQDAVGCIRSALDRIGLDCALQVLRPDYFTSPHPNLDELARLLPAVAAPLAIAIRLFSFGEPIALAVVEDALGRDVVEAGLICGLLQIDDRVETVSTNGFTVVTRLGQYFAASANPYYPAFDPSNADVYMGPDSFALANELEREAHGLPREGVALDLCTGSGIAAQCLAGDNPGIVWTGIDLSPAAVEAANFNAEFNGLAVGYRAIRGDLFSAVTGRRFELVTANPPFIPVPNGLPFPIYGAGGEDGRSVLRPLLTKLPNHLAPTGHAVIYGEGIGVETRLDVEDDLMEILATGFDVRLSIISAATIDNALYTIGAMLARQKPSRLPEIVHWRDLFARLGSELYAKFIIQVTPGNGALERRWLCPQPARLAAMTGQRSQSEGVR